MEGRGKEMVSIDVDISGRPRTSVLKHSRDIRECVDVSVIPSLSPGIRREQFCIGEEERRNKDAKRSFWLLAKAEKKKSFGVIVDGKVASIEIVVRLEKMKERKRRRKRGDG